jgi:hypothetical protein
VGRETVERDEKKACFGRKEEAEVEKEVYE